MAYDKQNFIHGQVLHASHLNHIEDGIEQLDTALTNLENEFSEAVDNLETTSERVEEIAEEMETVQRTNNDAFANAIKGRVTGSTVTLTDVSPIEHELSLRVHGKNLWNNFAFSTHSGGDSDVYVKEITEDSVIVTAGNSYNGNGHVETWVKLRDVCKQLTAGKTYTLQGKSSAWIKGIYLRNTDILWYFGTSLFVTEDILNSTVGFYGFHTTNGQEPGDNIISNIQIEVGEVSTDYVNYINPTTSQVNINGELLTVADESGLVSGVNTTYPGMTVETVNADMIVSVEYNRDATLVFNNLLERITALENA